MDISSKNNNQSSVRVTLTRKKISNQLSVKDHVSTNDKKYQHIKKEGYRHTPKNMPTYLNVKV